MQSVTLEQYELRCAAKYDVAASYCFRRWSVVPSFVVHLLIVEAYVGPCAAGVEFNLSNSFTDLSKLLELQGYLIGQTASL